MAVGDSRGWSSRHANVAVVVPLEDCSSADGLPGFAHACGGFLNRLSVTGPCTALDGHTWNIQNWFVREQGERENFRTSPTLSIPTVAG